MLQSIPDDSKEEKIFRELGVYGLVSSLVGICGCLALLIFMRHKNPDTTVFLIIQIATVAALTYAVWSTLKSLPLSFGIGSSGIAVYHWQELKEKIAWVNVTKIESVNKGKAVWVVIHINNHKCIEILSPLSKSRRRLLFDIFRANLSDVPTPE